MRLLLAGVVSVLGSLTASGADVAAGLHVPSAPTHVIGDEIPLVWYFTNQTTEPLAFMWEGCCRLNGKLTVTALGQDVATVPPGPSTAHQFPKAARLEPGRAGEFKTLLSDWVRLTGSGRYKLEGSYIGILPSQNPQVPPSLALWKGQTATPPLELDILDVTDYLAQRPDRERARQVRLTLTGPARFSLTNSTRFQVHLTNFGPHARSLPWPQSAQLWVVDQDGARATGVSHYLGTAPTTIDLPPNGIASVPFALEPRELVGVPLGTYRVFVELNEQAGEPRVPSNPLEVRWQIDAEDVRGLLESAARGPTAGARNAPLVLLRTYLEDLGPQLSEFRAAPPEIAQLAGELELAACLKPMSPQPGRVDLRARVDAAGGSRFEEAPLIKCFPSAAEPTERLDRVLAVRRHLGWVVHLVLEPDRQVTLRNLFNATANLRHKDLGGPPAVALPHPETGAPIRALLQSGPAPANLVARIRRAQDGLALEIARRLPDPARPQLRALFQPDELPRMAFTALKAPGELNGLLRDGQLPFPRVLVLADPEMTWNDLEPFCVPLLSHVTQFDVVLIDGREASANIPPPP